ALLGDGDRAAGAVGRGAHRGGRGAGDEEDGDEGGDCSLHESSFGGPTLVAATVSAGRPAEPSTVRYARLDLRLAGGLTARPRLPDMEHIRVLIVDDQPLMSEALAV